MWSFVKFVLAVVLLIGVVMLVRSKVKGASWTASWNDNFGGLYRVGLPASVQSGS